MRDVLFILFFGVLLIVLVSTKDKWNNEVREYFQGLGSKLWKKERVEEERENE